MRYSNFAFVTFVIVACAQPQHENHKHYIMHRTQDPHDIATKFEWVTIIEYVTKAMDTSPTTQSEPHSYLYRTLSAVVHGSKPTSKIMLPTSSPLPLRILTSSAGLPLPSLPSVEPGTTTSLLSNSNHSGSSSSTDTSGHGTYKGDITYYAVGMGACGNDDSGKDNSENIVALSHEVMGSQSNDNPLCGKTVTIYGGGRIATAIVRDKCMGCRANDIDVSEKVYKQLYGGLSSGRISISWTLN